MKRTLNLKKRTISACLAGCLLFSGAGLIIRPAQAFAYAEEQTNNWVVAPSISGWSYDSFSAGNLFTAIPAHNAERPYSFTFTKDDDDSFQFNYPIFGAIEQGKFNYYSDNNMNGTRSPEEMVDFAQTTFAQWKPGNYTMKVTVPAYGDYKALTASVSFTVEQAENYWTQAPAIVSWNNGNDFSLPTAEAKFGSVKFTIYGAKTDSKGDYETGLYGGYVIDGTAVYYDSANKINDLESADEGVYLLVAKVAETAEYKGLETTVVFRVFSSSETHSALVAAREKAIDDIEDLCYEKGVSTDETNVQSAITSIKSADTLKKVDSWKQMGLVEVYRIYAENDIIDYAEKELKIDYSNNVTVNQQLDKIKNANTKTIEEIEEARKTARQSLDLSYLHNEARTAKTNLEEYARELSDLADGCNITTDELTAPFDNADTIEKLNALVVAANKSVARTAYNAGSTNLNNYRRLAKEVIEQTARYIGIEYKGDGTDDSSNVVVRYVEEATTGEKPKEQIEAVVTEALETEFVAILTRKQADLRADLEQIATRYAQQYPSVAQGLNGIIEQARTGMYQPETFAKSEEKYETYLTDIKGYVLGPAKTEAIKQIDDLLEETGLKNFEREKAVDAINAALSIEEVETILEAAINEIGSTLYGARAEKIAEFEAYAEKYYAEYNWRALKDSLTAGKAAINGAQKYADILGKFEDAKFKFYQAYVLAELNRYADIYAEYGVSDAVANAKTALGHAHTEEGCAAVLSEAEAAMCAVAKTNTASYLERDNPFYSSWDREPWVNEINAAQTIAKVDEAYRKAVAERGALIDARDSAIAAAQEMLKIYAGSYGIENNKDVETAITEVGRAQTADEVPLFFDKAKLEIDRVAEAQQQHVDSVNTALVVLVVLFGFTAVGLGVGLGLVLHRYLPKKKKGGKGRRIPLRQNPPQQYIPPQEQPREELPHEEQPRQDFTWEVQPRQDLMQEVPVQQLPEEVPVQQEQSYEEQPREEMPQPQEPETHEEPTQTPPEE